jgi:hypothetical protein
MAKKPLEIDMCGGSQLRDTQGEMLSVEGADISELEAGKGRFNDNHGKGFFNSIGRVTAAKKIFKEEDCDDDRQKYYWNKVRAPYIYVRGFLYDDEDHPNAKAAAAILRNVHRSDCPLKLKASVEGGVISRGISDTTLLARTKIHSLALTFTPANNATLVEPLNLDKSAPDTASDLILINSVLHLAQTNVPSFRHITRDASASKVVANIEKIASLVKGEKIIDVPTKQHIIQSSLESKIQNNVVRIHESVEKALKDKLAGAAMMGAAALSPTQAEAPTIEVPPQARAPQDLSKMPPEHQKAYQDYAKKDPLLGAIGMVESSGGQNYAHKPVKNGHAAGGMFGMMPTDAEYILHNDPKLAAKYPDLLEASKDMGKNHKMFTDRFNSNDESARDFAEASAARKKSKTKDLNMLIHSWNHGLKGTWDKYKNEGPEAIQNDSYVKKVLDAYGKLTSKQRNPASNLKKGLCAGYGSGGVPTANTGGGVLQSEALDDGRGSKDKGFKYVTCDDCGKEQIYSKYQVKCRDCNKSFTMDKLHKLFQG